MTTLTHPGFHAMHSAPNAPRVAPVMPTWRIRHARLASNALIAMALILVIEGAFRKWVSPGLTVPLVGIRDMLAAGFIVLAWHLGYLSPKKPLNAAMLTWFALVVAWGLLQVIAGASSPMMLAVGLRFWCLYIAFGLAAGQMLDRQGMVRFVRLCMWLLVLMAPLTVFQFFSAPSAFINKQVDGDEADIFLVAAGVVRTTGTFSFTLGYTNFLHLISPLVIAGFMERRRLGISRSLSMVSITALMVATGVSGSRSAIVTLAGLVLFGSLFSFLMARGELKFKSMLLLLCVALLGAVVFAVLPEAVEAITTRFQQASDAEDFATRLGVMFFGGEDSFDALTFIGSGLGVGSGLASVVSTGQRLFLAGEAENARVLAEGGAIGVLYIFIKVFIAIAGAIVALKESVRINSSLPILIWAGFVVALFTWPSIGQLTSHGMLALYVALATFAIRQGWFAKRFSGLGL